MPCKMNRQQCLNWKILLVFYINGHFVHGLQFKNKEQTSTACGGRCSYQYSLQCPASRRIAIHALEYASKSVTPQCPNIPEPCQDKDTCCSYDPGDCRVPFSDSLASRIYSKCSGQQGCHGLKAEQISTASSCFNSRNLSNYVVAKYSCEEETTFVDICSNRSAYGKNINLILNGSQTTVNPGFKNSNLCACVVSTSDCKSGARLMIGAVDVRLHKNQDITQCHPHSSFDITDGEYNSRPRSFKCAQNHFYRNIDLYYTIKPYARISLYNKPEFNISQLWLNIKATYSDVDVMVTCGSAAIHQASQNICIPPDFYPTTTPPSVQRSTEAGPVNGKAPGTGDIGQQKDWGPIIAGAVSAVAIVLLLIVACCCCRRWRMRKLEKNRDEVFSHSLAVTAPPIPTAEDNDYNEYHEVESYAGNYYDSVGNGNNFSQSPFVQPVTPGKNMGSFFPADGKKVLPPVVPVKPPSLPSSLPPSSPAVAKKVAPVTSVPKSPSVERPQVTSQSSYDKDANPYHQPWDGKPLVIPNRKKKSDLAYATSEEIQVLIQKMDDERRRLNDGNSEDCRSPTGFIHIDDYKLSRSQKARLQEEDEEESSEEQNDLVEENIGQRLNNRHSVHAMDDRHLPEHLDRHDVMCSSEDTGYRSVGSQEQILVSEDDYLIPGAAKNRKDDTPQRPPSQVSVKMEAPVRYRESRSSVSGEKRSVSGEDKGNVSDMPLLAEQYTDVCDAIDKDQTEDATTKL